MEIFVFVRFVYMDDEMTCCFAWCPRHCSLRLLVTWPPLQSIDFFFSVQAWACVMLIRVLFTAGFLESRTLSKDHIGGPELISATHLFFFSSISMSFTLE